MNIFDNIGCEFTLDGKNLKILGSLPGYGNIDTKDQAITVPYLARNIIDSSNIEYEVGTAAIEKKDYSIEITNRKVITSSNNNNIVNFSAVGKKEFYIFVNTSNFNVAFNNVSFQNKDFTAQKKKTLYIVDVSSGYVKAFLPNASECEALELQFKVDGNGSLSIEDSSDYSAVLKENQYISLVSTGKNWIELKNESNGAFGIQSEPVFSSMSDPNGEDRSLQYKDGSIFAGSLIYVGNNNKILFGSSTESLAKHIIPPSGSNNIVINQTKEASSLIVHGSGLAGYPDKNLYFSSDGRLGINMPSGINTGSLIKPATVFHIINTFCQEGIRLENRTTCNPADITLYNNPPATLSDKSTVGQLSFKAKNSSGNKVTYSQIKSTADSVASAKGQLDIVLNNSASTITTVTTNPDYTVIKNQNSMLSISGVNAELRAANNILMSGTSIGLIAGTGATGSTISVSGALLANTELKLPYITQTNVLLGIDGNKKIVAATGFKIPGIAGDGKRKILTTEPDGTVVATSQLDSFWPYETGEKLGGKDLIWSRYPYRSGEICLGKTTKELQFSNTAPEDEYRVGDQIAIEIYNTTNNTVSTIHRNISSIIPSGSAIGALVVDEDINITEQSTLKIYSVSRGGILTNTIYTSGISSDATANIISSRPGVSTIFNTLSKDINFTIYGTDTVPALNVLASASSDMRNSGVYFKYATQFMDSNSQDVSPQQTSVGSNGVGLGNSISNNSVNYNEAADPSVWSNGVTSVGGNGKVSYYGTADQNGNVFEWVEDDEKISSSSSYQYICGGSWRSPEPDNLRSYISTPRSSGFDDIGFRICSKAGFSSESINQLLNLNFVRVDDINNIADDTPLYTESYDNRFNIKASPDPISVQNLGVVNYSYNISKFEITNNQYATFLNTVATGSYPNGLYRTEMASSSAGGILQSGAGTNISPYTYHVKSNMGNMPVVYIEYLSAIRFVNWINNLSKEYSTNDLENGSYSIYGISQSVTKYSDQNYWIPSLNEWHKAAYYMPMGRPSTVSSPAITIKRSDPFVYEEGKLSSVSISGHLYADALQIGNGASKSLQTTISGSNFRVGIGPDNAVVDTDLGTYSNLISNTGITFATNGTTLFINRINPTTVVKMTPVGTQFYGEVFIGSGVTAANIHNTGLPGGGMRLTPSGLEFVDSSGNTVPGGMFPGEIGGFLYKQTDKATYASSKLMSVNITGVYYPKIANTNNYEVIHNNDNGVLSSSDWFRVGYIPPNTENLGEKVVSISSTGTGLGADTPVLYTNRILIGPPLEGYAGSILTHNGLSPATWEPNDFFKAPGAVWTRYGRRSVEILDSSKIKFTTNLTTSQGGTGQVGVGDIEEEFAYNETIALVNQDREVFYVKVSNIDLTDAYPEDDISLWSNDNDRNNLILTICPPLPDTFIENSLLDLADSPMNGKPIAYAFSVQKGAYMDMTIEPDATTGFNCITSDEVADSDYRFKPSTKNTFSIRPNIHTAFNKLADDIDFVVYGHRKTLFTRYEPEWFDLNDNGIPANLIPAFRIHSHIDNSVEGNIESGIFRDTIANNTTAINIRPDLYSKITINMHEPYKIASLTGIKIGVINPAETIEANKLLEKEYGMIIDMADGAAISGTTDISKYADLSINGTTYTSGLIAKDIVLTPLWEGPGEPDFETATQQKIYAPNYPLTINSKGQIVSLIPPPQPEPPSAPLNIVGTARNQSIVLDWDSPDNDGGDPIVDYIIEYSSDSGATWQKFEEFGIDGLKIKSAITSKTISPLTNNLAYVFRVYAVNGIGIGPVSDTSSPITPLNIGPTSPRNLAVTGQGAEDTRPSINVVLTWNEPLSKGLNASTITYSVDYLIDDASIASINNASWTPVTVSNISEKTITIQNIDQGKYVYFRVTAHNNLNHQSDPAIYRSIGTGDDPRLVGPNQPNVPNQYDFGTIICSGVCL